MKKLYYKVILFFHNLYVNFLLRRTARLVAKSNRAEQKILSLLQGERYYQYLSSYATSLASKNEDAEQKMERFLQGDPRYYQYVATRTHSLIEKATHATTVLLPLLGKDPNYVPPPPPPPQAYKPVDVDESKAAWVVDVKERPTRMASVDSNNQWVKNPASNPVYQSRLAWEEKQRKAAEPQVTETTELSGAAIDSLRAAMSDIEAELSDKKPE